MDNYNTELEKSQECKLNDEIKEKFTPKRKASELLSQSYYRIGYEDKAERVADCGSLLEFRKPLDCSEGFKLTMANFCRDRLCPMCSWRRSYKIFGQVSKIMDNICNDYAFIFLTLTMPNSTAETLSKAIDDIQKGFYTLSHYKRFRKAVRGFFKALEVTRNVENGTYHPHLHIILAVDVHYFKDTRYIKRDEWLEMWQKAMHDSSITQVDVRRCRSKHEIQEGETAVKTLSSAVAEVAKYSVKSKDYIIPDNEALTDEVVFVLGSALANRRLCSFGGIFEEWRKKLLLDDCENGDLIHLDGERLRSDVGYMVARFGWSCGAYKLISFEKEIDVTIDSNEDVN